MRPIDADALLKKQTTIRVTYHCQGADEWDDYEAVLVKDINNAPTLSPDEVRGVGEWISAYCSGVAHKRCSECGTYIEDDFFAFDYSVNYCPSCGARMKGAEDDDSV